MTSGGEASFFSHRYIFLFLFCVLAFFFKEEIKEKLSTRSLPFNVSEQRSSPGK